MKPIQGYHLIKPEDLHWRPSNLMRIPSERLNKIKGISCLLPQGAFYAFPKVSDLYTKKISGQSVTNSFDLVNLLLEKAHVA
jgi:aspartate/methionine/tyrosine aminotransferase